MEVAMNRIDSLEWNDDVRDLPERLQRQADKLAAEKIADAWRKDLERRGMPRRTQVRWVRAPGGRHGTKGELLVVDGLPQCDGLMVVVRGRPQDRIGKDGTLRRVYPTYQRRTLKDGTPLHTLEAAWRAYDELRAEVEALEDTNAAVAGHSAPTLAEHSLKIVPTFSMATGASLNMTMQTRGGAALAGLPMRHFSDAEKTFGAVLARMETNPLRKTRRYQIHNNRLLAQRVLQAETRLDLITSEGMERIYEEIGGLHKLIRRKGQGWVETDELIGSSHHNLLWRSFMALRDYAEREGWLPKIRVSVDLVPTVNRSEVRILSSAETLRLERVVLTLAEIGKRDAITEVLPAMTPIRGRIPFSKRWAHVRRDFAAPDGGDGTIDVRMARVAHIPIVHLNGGVCYFATGLAAYVMTATALAPRGGELGALCWNSIDFEKGTIAWERRVLSPDHQRPGSEPVRIGDGTKNTRGDKVVRRTVYMTARVRDALEHWRAERAQLWLAMGWQVPMAAFGGLVFPSVTGRVLPPDSSVKLWQAAERTAGVSVTRQHAVRHAVTTRNAAANINPATTSAMIGNSVATLIKKYLIVTPEMRQEFADFENDWRERMERQRGA
jgi:integrase